MRKQAISLCIWAVLATIGHAQLNSVIDLRTTWNHPVKPGGAALDVRNWWIHYKVQWVDTDGQHNTITLQNLVQTGAQSDDLAHQCPTRAIAGIPGWNPDSPYITWTAQIRGIPSATGPNYVLHQEAGAPIGPWYRVYASTWGYLEYSEENLAWETKAADRQLNQYVVEQ